MTAALRIVVAALAFAVVGGIGAPVAGLAPVAEVRAAATDLTLVTNAAYTVRPKDQRVGISVAIAATNHTRETKTRRFFFDHAYLAVQAGTTGFRLSGAKGSTVRVARRGKDSTLLRLDFGRRLYSGDHHDYRLTFDMLGAGRGANPQTRVGTGLVTVPLWAYASNGAKGSTVSIAFPKGWDVAVESGSMPGKGKGPDGGTILRSGPIAAPLTWFAYVTGQQPAVYEDHELQVKTLGGSKAPLVLRAWKDDPAWANRTGQVFRRGLPVLASMIGMPWPEAEPTVISEAVSRADDAYAGLFDPAEHRIEVAYWADSLTTLHEAAHGWFNGSLLADRWANEGFASYYANRAAGELDIRAKDPVISKKARAAAVPLNAWPLNDPAGTGAVSGAVESYGYAASHQLAQAIAERAGDDVLGRVWADAAARVGAYQPPVAGAAGATPSEAGAAPESVAGPPDWRGLLDLLEAESGQDFTDLWRQWVVRPEEQGVLDARAAARMSYERTLALAGDWQLPRAVRDAMRAWQFDEAEQQMADARTVLAQHKALADMAAKARTELPDLMRTPFEEGRMADASATAEAQRNALLAFNQAEGARSADGDVLSRIGMLGEEPEADLATARAAFAAGDLDGTLAAADDAYRAWTGAWQEGRRRLMLALAGLATVLVVVSAIASTVRRNRRAARASAAHASPGPR